MMQNRSYLKIVFSTAVMISIFSAVLLAGAGNGDYSSTPIHVELFIKDKKISLGNSGNFFVTILSTNGFNATDAASGVNISSVRFQGVPPTGNDNSDRVNLRLHFPGGSELQCGNDRTVYLIGKTIDGRDIVGWAYNITIDGCKYNGDYQPRGAPNITSFSPPTPVTNNVGEPITFSITVNQTVDIIWYFSGTLIQLNASVPEVTESSYTISSPSNDTWNVTAIANNANGTDSQIWEWISNKAGQIITFDPPADMTYGDPDLTVSATASSGLPVSFTAAGTCTVSGSNARIVGAGICTITAQQPGNESYNAAPDVERSFNISKRPLTITSENRSKTYGAVLPLLTVNYTGLVNGDTAPAIQPTVTTTATASSPVGTYPITAAGAEDPNYTISYAPGTLTITAAELTITADDRSKIYGAELPPLTVNYTGLVNGDMTPAIQPTVTTTATASSPVGTYPITAAGAQDPNYTISYVPGTLTVTSAALTITAGNRTKAYGAVLPPLTVNYTGLVNGDTAPAIQPTVTTTATESSPAGTYPITAAGAQDPNYTISYVPGTLTVTSAPLITEEPDLIPASSSTASGSSGCGGDVYTKEKPSNVKQHEFSREVDVYKTRNVNSFYFKTLSIVSEIGFTARTNERCMTALGEILKNRPAEASSDVPYPLIGYFNAWVGPRGYSESSLIEDTYVIFRVSEGSEPVQLMMYRNGEWTGLRTEKIGNGTFKAYSTGFGSFAIVEVPGTAPVQQQTLALSAVTGDPQKPVNWFLIILAVVVFATVVVMYHHIGKG